jgi:hypothetical protein
LARSNPRALSVLEGDGEPKQFAARVVSFEKDVVEK